MRGLDGHIEQSICNGDLEALKTLLQGKNINSPLQSGWTPLQHACIEGQDKIVDYLLKHGAQPDCHYEFFTPLMAVCTSTSLEEERLARCARSLIEFKADVNAMDKQKSTALIIACTKGHEKVVAILLDAHCDVNKVDNDGFSALHVACIYIRPNIVRMLLDHGADKCQKDQRGRSPLALATAKGAHEIIQMLDYESKRGLESKPEVEITDHTTEVMKKSSFEKLLTELPCYNNSSGRDGFHKDVAILLSGMRLEQRVGLFFKKRVSLAHFINIKNDELREMGVHFSSHREKIITGNKQFICHPWAFSSLPECKKGSEDIMDMVRSLANIVKQLHIIWATALYSNERVILPDNKEDQKVDDLYQIVLRTYRQTNALIKELKLIKEQTEYLNKVQNVQPADLILPMKRSACFSVGKVFLATAVCTFVFWKIDPLSMLRK